MSRLRTLRQHATRSRSTANPDSTGSSLRMCRMAANPPPFLRSCILHVQCLFAQRLLLRGPMALRDFVMISIVVLSACIGRDRADQGRGSESCRVWQDAACDHFADECEAVDRALCDQQYQSITCRSDKVADKCTKMLRAASCGSASPDCLLSGVADPDPAHAACEELADRFCERALECGLARDKQPCVDSATSVLVCERAVGFQLGFEKCLKDVDKADCTALVMPPSCEAVIVLPLRE